MALYENQESKRYQIPKESMENSLASTPSIHENFSLDGNSFSKISTSFKNNEQFKASKYFEVSDFYTISLLDFDSIESKVSKRNVGAPCSFKYKPNCTPTIESEYNSTCCTPDEPCGILQGGCNTDDDCFDNLECIIDTCGIENNGTKCCQAPGRKPSK